MVGFEAGTYERVFAASSAASVCSSLNGHDAIADSSSPMCIARNHRTNEPADRDDRNLDGVAGIGGQQTAYHYEYGTRPNPDTWAIAMLPSVRGLAALARYRLQRCRWR